MKPPVLFLLMFVFACSDGPTARQSERNGDVQAHATIAPPKVALKGRVTDDADILDAMQEASLSKRLERLERATGHQMVVVTVRTLAGQDVSSFTRELGNAWGIGRAKWNDGVILLVAPNERQVRIAVGSGLEKILPDIVCQRILHERVLPRFRAGDMPGGIDAGMSALIENLSENVH